MLLIGRLISNHVGNAHLSSAVFYHALTFLAPVGERVVVAFIIQALNFTAVVLEKILYAVGFVVLRTGIRQWNTVSA